MFLTETSVDIQLRTRQYIPEDSQLHTRRCQSLKSHRVMRVSTPSPSLLVLGGLASDSEKAEALTDSLEAQFQPVNDPLSPVVRRLTRRCVHTSVLPQVNRN
jgi:hypothetical protein